MTSITDLDRMISLRANGHELLAVLEAAEAFVVDLDDDDLDVLAIDPQALQDGIGTLRKALRA